MKAINRKDQATLVDALLRNWKFQTPTPVVEEGKPLRYVVTIFAEDFRRMLGIATAAGDFVMPPEDKERLVAEFAEKAKTAAGGYDLASWSMGQLEAAYEDTQGVEPLAPFRAAVSAEIKTRASTAGREGSPGSALH